MTGLAALADPGRALTADASLYDPRPPRVQQPAAEAPSETPPAPNWSTLTPEQYSEQARRQNALETGDFMAGLKSGWEQTKGLGALAVSALGQKASELTDGVGDGTHDHP